MVVKVVCLVVMVAFVYATLARLDSAELLADQVRLIGRIVATIPAILLLHFAGAFESK